MLCIPRTRRLGTTHLPPHEPEDRKECTHLSDRISHRLDVLRCIALHCIAVLHAAFYDWKRLSKAGAVRWYSSMQLRPLLTRPPSSAWHREEDCALGTAQAHKPNTKKTLAPVSRLRAALHRAAARETMLSSRRRSLGFTDVTVLLLYTAQGLLDQGFKFEGPEVRDQSRHEDRNNSLLVQGPGS